MPELNRRDFLKKAAIGAAVVTGAGVITGCQGSTQASASTATNNFDHEADVVVVGMGLGGLTASLRAAELDAKVITIDKDPTGDWVGGNFPLSGQSIHVALTNPHYPIDELKRKFDEATSGTISPEMRDVYCERAHEAIKWFEALGIQTEDLAGRTCRVLPAKKDPWPYWWRRAKKGAVEDYQTNGAFAASKLMEEKFVAAGGTVMRGLAAKKLITDENLNVVGVIAKDTEGNTVRLGGKAVILATGGFQANRELVSRYLGTRAENWVPSGTPYNTGDGHLMCLEVGAQFFNMSAFYATLEPEIAMHDRDAIMTFSFPYAAATNGIVVDEFGNRFCDESGDRHVIAHELVKKVSMNTRGVVLFDSKIYENNVIKPLIDEMIGLGGYVVAADTLGEIAEKTGISKRLIDTVAEFNRAVDQNATDRLPVPKTNLINKIDTAPYYAIPILPGTPYTQGGPRVNTKGEVLDTDGKPIKGLYATGDLMSGNLTGLYVNRFGGYTGGLCTALTFGLITAENAVKL